MKTAKQTEISDRPADQLSLTPMDASATSSFRVFLNRLLFRGLIFFCGFVAVILHPLSQKIAWRWVAFSARLVARTTGVRVKIEGLENLPPGPCIVTPNHASHFDIAALLGYLPGQNRFAAKKELFREPILGLAMKTLGMIPIDREDPEKSIDRLNRLQEKGGGEFSVIIFPEGTRSSSKDMRPFKKGAFALAIQLGRPIVPIAIRGSAHVMPAGKYLSIYPGAVSIEILPPIETGDLTLEDRQRLCDDTHRQIAQRLESE